MIGLFLFNCMLRYLMPKIHFIKSMSFVHHSGHFATNITYSIKCDIY